MPSHKKVVKISGKSAQEIYEKVDQTIESFLTKASIGEFEIERKAAKKNLQFKSKMASGDVHCKDGEVIFELSLSLLALPFKSKIDEGIDRWVNKHFV